MFRNKRRPVLPALVGEFPVPSIVRGLTVGTVGGGERPGWEVAVATKPDDVDPAEFSEKLLLPHPTKQQHNNPVNTLLLIIAPEHNHMRRLSERAGGSCRNCDV